MRRRHSGTAPLQPFVSQTQTAHFSRLSESAVNTTSTSTNRCSAAAACAAHVAYKHDYALPRRETITNAVTSSCPLSLSPSAYDRSINAHRSHHPLRLPLQARRSLLA